LLAETGRFFGRSPETRIANRENAKSLTIMDYLC